MSVNKYGIFKYLETVSRAAHKHSDLYTMTTAGIVLRAQACEVRNGGSHIMFPITNNTFLPILVAYFWIACWKLKEINARVRKKGSGKKVTTKLDVNVRGGENWFRIMSSCELWYWCCWHFVFWYHRICYSIKSISGREDLRKEGGWICLRIASNSGHFLFHFF